MSDVTSISGDSRLGCRESIIVEVFSLPLEHHLRSMEFDDVTMAN
jgi:hypothetical protein